MKYNSQINTNFKRILVTGGAGFIGGALIRKLFSETNAKIFNLDKLSYSSDLSFLNYISEEEVKKRHKLLKVDLCDSIKLRNAIKESDPDLVFHLAAESHVDRSIDSPKKFINSNIIGTFNLLEALLEHFKLIEDCRRKHFKCIHISTDEVFGSLDNNNYFDEKTNYKPTSPYSATKAASDHLAKAWYKTYGLPIIISNCSNNYGPYQFPEKLIPLVINKALNKKPIPIYGNGMNVRDWLYVEDHVDALILIALKGNIGESYCIGGREEKTNKEIVETICYSLDELVPTKISHKKLINFVEDRPGHDYRYSINPSYIESELGWTPKYSYKEALKKTIKWYLNNQDWHNLILEKSGYQGERLGKTKF